MFESVKKTIKYVGFSSRHLHSASFEQSEKEAEHGVVPVYRNEAGLQTIAQTTL